MTAPAALHEMPWAVRLAPLSEVRDLPVWHATLRGSVKDHRYHEIVADSLGDHFDCHALILEDACGAPRAVQPCFFVEQDLTVTAPLPIRWIVRQVRRVAPRFLRLRMLMIGCAAGEGHAGSDDPAFMQAIGAALPQIAREHGASLVVWKDFPAYARGLLAPLSRHFTRLASMPATRLALDFASFDDYLARRLSHATRKNLRRKFRALKAAPPITMMVTTNVAEVVDEVHTLYLQVFARSSLRFERLTKDFLLQLGERLPDRVRFFTWRQDGQLIAFSLCHVHDGVLYDDYLGLDYRVALDLHLYFVTFRDVFSWAIAQGLREYRSTPLNYDPKLHFRFELVPLDLYAAHPSPLLNAALRLALPWLGPTRGETVLRRFPNADQL